MGSKKACPQGVRISRPDPTGPTAEPAPNSCETVALPTPTAGQKPIVREAHTHSATTPPPGGPNQNPTPEPNVSDPVVAARNAVLSLVRFLGSGVAFHLAEVRADAHTQHDQILVKRAITATNEQVARAESLVAPVRHVLTAASGVGRSAADDVLLLAAEFRAWLIGLTSPSSPPQPDEAEKRLAGFALKLGKYTADIGRFDPPWAAPRGVIHQEAAQAAALFSLTAASTHETVPEEPMTALQRRVWAALDGNAMTADDLAKKLICDRGTLITDHLGPLMADERIKNNRKVGGYYRPDKPPTTD